MLVTDFIFPHTIMAAKATSAPHNDTSTYPSMDGIAGCDPKMVHAVLEGIVRKRAFELLAGHYLFGNSWGRLLEDYNLLRGRIWVLVLVTTAVAPVLATAVSTPAQNVRRT